jgi:hypothetical protein
MNGKGSKPRPYSVSPEEFEANYNAIFRKSKARKALQRWALDGSQKTVVHHVGPEKGFVATQVRIDQQRIRA